MTPERALIKELMLAKRYGEALPHLAALYATAEGKDALTVFNYSYCLHLAGEFRTCLEVLDEAIAAYPNFSQLYALRGGTWQMFGAYDKMMEDCRMAVALDPNNLHARYALSLRELMVSNLEDGFEGYSDRMFAPLEQPIRYYNLPTWEGEEMRGKRLLLSWEQGVGDIIMFASFVPYLLGKGMLLTITVPEKLRALFARSFPEAEVVVVTDSGQEAALERRCDAMVLMGDLIELCLPHYRPADHPPYLRADAERAAALRAKYKNMMAALTASLPESRSDYRAIQKTNTTVLSGFPYNLPAANSGNDDLASTRKPNESSYFVGIAWHTTNPMTAQVRNIQLEQWRPLFDLPGVRFVSLQYGQHEGMPETVYCDPEIDAFTDQDALAAQIAAMDEVITIQNATAHLAGALGVPTTLLLSTASDWRWGIGRERGAWYGSVRIVRQQEPLIWAPVMERVAQELRGRIG